MSRTKEAARAPLRDPLHVPNDRVVARDRDGNPIYRRMASVGDKYKIDPRIIEPGWVYEWKRYSVHNMEDPGYQSSLGQNGWRPVLAERHDGMFLPVGAKGAIIRDGLILMERPAALNDEEREESRRKARSAIDNVKALHGQRVGDADGRVVRDRQATYIREDREAIVIDPDE